MCHHRPVADQRDELVAVGRCAVELTFPVLGRSVELEDAKGSGLLERRGVERVVQAASQPLEVGFPDPQEVVADALVRAQEPECDVFRAGRIGMGVADRQVKRLLRDWRERDLPVRGSVAATRLRRDVDPRLFERHAGQRADVQDAEQQVLGVDVGVAKLARLILRALEHPPCAGRERHGVRAGPAAAPADPAHRRAGAAASIRRRAGARLGADRAAVGLGRSRSRA